MSMKKKIKQCPDSDLWCSQCRTCIDWYDCYQDYGPNPEATSFCLNSQCEKNRSKHLRGEDFECKFFMEI